MVSSGGGDPPDLLWLGTPRHLQPRSLWRNQGKMQQTREPLAPQGVGGVGGLRWSSNGSYISERHDWIGAVCIVYVMLPVSSSVPQERDVASGQLVFNNVCRTCHTTREGDTTGSVPTCTRLSAGKQVRFKTMATPARFHSQARANCAGK